MTKSEGDKRLKRLNEIARRNDEMGELAKDMLIMNESIVIQLNKIKRIETALKNAGISLPSENNA